MIDINTFLLDQCDNSQNFDALIELSQQKPRSLAPHHPGTGYTFSWGYLIEIQESRSLTWCFCLPGLLALYEQNQLTLRTLQAQVKESLKVHYPGFINSPRSHPRLSQKINSTDPYPERGVFSLYGPPDQAQQLRQLIHNDLENGLMTHLITECYLYIIEKNDDE